MQYQGEGIAEQYPVLYQPLGHCPVSYRANIKAERVFYPNDRRLSNEREAEMRMKVGREYLFRSERRVLDERGVGCGGFGRAERTPIINNIENHSYNSSIALK